MRISSWPRSTRTNGTRSSFCAGVCAVLWLLLFLFCFSLGACACRWVGIPIEYEVGPCRPLLARLTRLMVWPGLVCSQFRGFVMNNELTALCQYYHFSYFPTLVENKARPCLLASAPASSFAVMALLVPRFTAGQDLDYDSRLLCQSPRSRAAQAQGIRACHAARPASAERGVLVCSAFYVHRLWISLWTSRAIACTSLSSTLSVCAFEALPSPRRSDC